MFQNDSMIEAQEGVIDIMDAKYESVSIINALTDFSCRCLGESHG